MKRALAAALVLLAPSIARADANAEAQALFEQGIKDMQAGNLDAGCRELAASLAKAEDSGTKGALATCYTKQGKLASAWSMWNILASTATKPEDRVDATNAAAALEPRLPHFQLRLAAAAPAGLVVTINGAPADATLAVPLPIDPGPVSVAARAPDHQDWAQSYAAVEGKTLTIEVPALVPLPKAGPGVTPPPVDGSAARHRRHVTGIAFGAGGLALAGVGLVFGAQASGKWDDAKRDCNGDVTTCPTGSLDKAKSDTSDARSAALISTLGVSVGGAAIIAGAILYLTAPAERGRPATALRLTPSVGPTSAGFVITGGW